MNRTIRTWVEISLSTLEHNYREIRAHLPEQCELLGICKANSYGHGAVRVAQLLQQLGCRWIAVNNYDEAEELRAAGISTEILLLSPQPANIAVDLVDLDVTQSISSLDYAQRLSRHLAGTEHNLKAHLKLETGMGRTGFDAMDDSHLDDLLDALKLPNLDITGIFTHMAVADEPGGKSAEERKPQRTKDDGKDPCAEEPERIPHRSKRRVDDRHDWRLGVEEVTVRRLALRHETRGIKVPSLILIEGPEPYGRKSKHDEPEGRQKPISLH